MPSITQDVTLRHRLQKSEEEVEIHLTAGVQVSIMKEWEHHYLIKTADGKVFNIKKEYVDAGS